MNTNPILAKVFTKALKTAATSYKGEFTNLVTETFGDPSFAAKQTELNAIVETNAQIEALRNQKKLLVAASRPAVTLDANGNAVKRGRGRPRTNPAPVATTTAKKQRGRPAKAKAKVVIPDAPNA